MEIYQKMIENNFPVGMIHGSLQTNERDYTVKKFREGKIRTFYQQIYYREV